MIDPTTSLAFSVHSGKGVYALLLGSGISRAAGIPTGWEVTLDLIRKIAVMQGEDCEPDPAIWYRSKFKSEPDYSVLLEKLAITPAERSNALAKYFEATAQDREQGKKVPTASHIAIARLVSKGYFRVILTTNFDRLLEQALEAASIQPTVISTADAVMGAVPLTHSRCTVIKIHGDYRDTRIRNTNEELATYSPEINALLDRVFDEYGLIICGWSGTWDEALRAAILRAPNRRYSMIWAGHGALTVEAKQLTAFRKAVEIPIRSANDFLSDLENKLNALERFDSPHPLSAVLAKASLKRFIVADEHRIELYDLVNQEVERQIDSLSKLSMDLPNLTVDQIFERMQQYEKSLDILAQIIAHGCYWGDLQHAQLWTATLKRIAELASVRGGMPYLLTLRLYPTCLLFYIGGLGAIAAGRYETLRTLCSTEMSYNNIKVPLILKAMPLTVLDNDIARQLPGLENQFTPLSNHLFNILRDPIRELIPSDERYGELFDRFEYLMSLIFFNLQIKTGGGRWAPVGRYQRGRFFGDNRVGKALMEEQQKIGDDWPPIKGGLFESKAHFLELNATFEANVLAYWR